MTPLERESIITEKILYHRELAGNKVGDWSKVILIVLIFLQWPWLPIYTSISGHKSPDPMGYKISTYSKYNSNLPNKLQEIF
jgi:hypothetical protein